MRDRSESRCCLWGVVSDASLHACARFLWHVQQCLVWLPSQSEKVKKPADEGGGGVSTGGGIGVLKICHEHAGARVEGVYHHLAVRGARDLHTPIQQVLWKLPHLHSTPWVSAAGRQHVAGRVGGG